MTTCEYEVIHILSADMKTEDGRVIDSQVEELANAPVSMSQKS